MSYGLQIRAATRALAKEMLAAQCADVMKGQPVHARDVPAVQAMLESHIDQVEESEANDIVVSGSGSVSQRTIDAVAYVGSSFTVQVAPKLVEAPKE